MDIDFMCGEQVCIRSHNGRDIHNCQSEAGVGLTSTRKIFS